MAIISYNIQDLINDLQSSGITFPFMFGITPTMLNPTFTNISNSPYTRFSGSTVNQWFFSGGFVSGFTNDKLNLVKSYDAADLYNPAVINNNDNYYNYLGTFISGATKVVDDTNPIIYAVDAESEFPFFPLIGTDAQTTGIRYKTYSDETYGLVSFDGQVESKPKTEFRFVGEGWNATNVDLMAYIRREYLMGIVSPPEVQSDVFIDRGATTVLEDHLILGEIRGLDALQDYRNGYFKFE
jgi:hypothetical protein